MPIDNVPLEEIAERATRMRDEASHRGPISVTLISVNSSPDHVVKAMELGIDRIVFSVPPGSSEEVLGQLDRLVEVRVQVTGVSLS